MVLTRWFEKRPVHIRARRIASKNALYTWLVDETVPLGGGEPPPNRRLSTEGVSVEIVSCRSNVISFMRGDRRKNEPFGSYIDQLYKLRNREI